MQQTRAISIYCKKYLQPPIIHHRHSYCERRTTKRPPLRPLPPTRRILRTTPPQTKHPQCHLAIDRKTTYEAQGGINDQVEEEQWSSILVGYFDVKK